MKTKLTFKQVQEALQEKSALIGTIFEEAGPDIDFSKVKCLGEGDTKAKTEKITQLNAELSDLHADAKEYQVLQAGRKAADEAAGFKGLPKDEPGLKASARPLGEQFAKSTALTHWNKDVHFDVDLKSIMQTGAGWDPENVRLPRVESYPLRRLRVADIFPTYPTIRDTITYMEETTHTNNAAEIAEETNAAAPTAAGEAALALTERSVPVEKIVVWIPVSEEQMADVSGLGAWLNDRLSYMTRNRLDGQLCAGDGSTPNIRGVLNASNIQSQALGTDPIPDAVRKAITKVRGVSAGTGFAEPSAILMHPNDWETTSLLRTADGLYLFGGPGNPNPPKIWGVPVVETAAETENTAVVGDFSGYSAFFARSGVDMAVSNSHASLFAASVLAIRATLRGAAVYFRGSAFCKVTGI